MGATESLGIIIKKIIGVKMLCSRLVLFAGFLVLAVASSVQGVNPPTCDMVTSNTVDFKCPENTTCPDKVPDTTTVHTSCKAGHIPTEYLQNMMCRDGSWSSIPTCKPECGLLNPSADVKTLPWNVGIYEVHREIVTNQICEGTLIYSNIVIGAAQCFFDYQTQSVSPPHRYRVVIGKSVRTWNHEEEKDNPNIQKSEVSKIMLHDLYDGPFGVDKADVAILVLKTPFKLSDSIRPACYDLTDGDFNRNQMTPGNFGKVVGWGPVETENDSLKVLSLPVVDIQECREEMLKHRMSHYVTLDKFCAGTLDATALCHYGSGLVIPLKETTKSAPRYYLRGVASTGPVKPMRCSGNTYTLFASLYTLRDWLIENLSRLT